MNADERKMFEGVTCECGVQAIADVNLSVKIGHHLRRHNSTLCEDCLLLLMQEIETALEESR